MSDVIALADARRDARANLTLSWLEGGALRVYSAPVPETPDTAIDTQTLLVEFPLPDPFGTVEDGVLTAETIAPAMIAAEGTAAWARAVDAAGEIVADFSVGLTDSGEAVEIDNLSLVSGAIVTVTSFVYAEG